jgi:GTP-binding protein Era
MTRSGYVALVGRPNAGKSTLMNALVGDKLSIVTPKAQTTWQRVTGILTTDTSQAIFLDTPGLLEVKDLLQRSMLGAALEALAEADVVLVVLDAERGLSDRAKNTVRQALESAPGVPVLAAVNKIDLAPASDTEALERWAREVLDADAYRISALSGEGVATLGQALDDALPEGPFLYPADEIASQPVRFFVAELVRETVFEQFREEIPYSVFVQVEEFREHQDPVYIGATVHVERNSQKRILIGDKGRAVKELGQSARRKIEALLDHPVYLDLWVKHLPNWRRKRTHLKKLGFKVPDDHELVARS